MKQQLVISTSIDLVRIAPDHVVYFASDGNTFNHTVTASKEALKQLKELLEKEAR